MGHKGYIIMTGDNSHYSAESFIKKKTLQQFKSNLLYNTVYPQRIPKNIPLSKAGRNHSYKTNSAQPWTITFEWTWQKISTGKNHHWEAPTLNSCILTCKTKTTSSPLTRSSWPVTQTPSTHVHTHLQTAITSKCPLKSVTHSPPQWPLSGQCHFSGKRVIVPPIHTRFSVYLFICILFSGVCLYPVRLLLSARNTPLLYQPDILSFSLPPRTDLLWSVYGHWRVVFHLSTDPLSSSTEFDWTLLGPFSVDPPFLNSFAIVQPRCPQVIKKK